MTQVSAPYNFVPLNEKVFFPPWADLVSHDVPFKNGLSGQIELEITAESPIFIRKPYEESDEYYTNANDEKISKEFCHIKDEQGNKRYYIPGSSIKGEIASVLEILTFSKLRFFNDIKYSQREWGNDYLYPRGSFAAVKGGWLSLQNNGKYLIEYNSTENPGRISHEELNNRFTNFANNFTGNPRADFDKSAKKKYNLTSRISNDEILFWNDNFTPTSIPNQVRGDSRKAYSFDVSSSKSGTIIFTGQSSNNNTGKKYEFIFWDTNKHEELDADDIRIKSFRAAYDDGDSKKESIDWIMWKKHLRKGGKIPIFITLKNNKIQHFGLSMLYKLPYNKSVGDIIKDNISNDHFDKKKDFVETIFGDIKEVKRKGRVHFSHAFTQSEAINVFQNALTITLGSPKATYYPYYIEQDINNGDFEINGNYNYYNRQGKIAGRKRYPVMIRNSEHYNNPIYQGDEGENTTTSFIPLEEGVKFNCKINFYNLLEEELGALISAITFHGNENRLHHNIGMVKPYGMGNVSTKIKNLKVNNKKVENYDKYLCSFEKLMNSEINNWINTEQIKELVALSTPISNNQNSLAYLNLEIGGQNNTNEFQEIKNEGKALPRYSIFMNITETEITSKITHDNNSVDYKEYSISEVLKNKKQNIKNSIDTKFKEINNSIKEIKSKKVLSQGVDLQDISEYSSLIRKINDYKRNQLIISDSESLYDKIKDNENIINSIVSALDVVFSRLKGKKKKLFLNNNSKLNTISTWIGKEKATQWFNSKKQQS